MKITGAILLVVGITTLPFGSANAEDPVAAIGRVEDKMDEMIKMLDTFSGQIRRLHSDLEEVRSRVSAVDQRVGLSVLAANHLRRIGDFNISIAQPSGDPLHSDSVLIATASVEGRLVGRVAGNLRVARIQIDVGGTRCGVDSEFHRDEAPGSPLFASTTCVAQVSGTAELGVSVSPVGLGQSEIELRYVVIGRAG